MIFVSGPRSNYSEYGQKNTMRIERVIAQILRLPRVDAKTAGTQDTLIVRVCTDTGLEGIGEVDSSPEVAKAVDS